MMNELVVLPQVLAWIGMVSIAVTVISLGVLVYWISNDGFTEEEDLEPQIASIWHDKTERPKKGSKVAVCVYGSMFIIDEDCLDKFIISKLEKWAYISDVVKLK